MSKNEIVGTVDSFNQETDSFLILFGGDLPDMNVSIEELHRAYAKHQKEPDECSELETAFAGFYTDVRSCGVACLVDEKFTLTGMDSLVAPVNNKFQIVFPHNQWDQVIGMIRKNVVVEITGRCPSIGRDVKGYVLKSDGEANVYGVSFAVPIQGVFNVGIYAVGTYERASEALLALTREMEKYTVDGITDLFQ